MSKKLILNFICKNESKVIGRMLTSALPITDVIVVVDTGSTDGTQEIIREFGVTHDIPTFIYEVPFTNFAESRNVSREKCDEVVELLKLDRNKTWSYFFDCDEELQITTFKKDDLILDLYMVETIIGSMKYTRNTFTKLSKKFEWTGPIHEFIQPVGNDIQAGGLLQGISVLVSMDGNSWQDGNRHDKYKKHAIALEDFITHKENRTTRWIFYTAQSWFEAASSGDKRIDQECLKRALVYYQERMEHRTSGMPEELYFSQFRIGLIKKLLEYPWGESMQELLKAYSIDPIRAEAMNEIMDYYAVMGEWNLAYLYSKINVINFHGKNPYKSRFLFVETNLHNWRIINTHAVICLHVNRKEESFQYYNEVLDIYAKHPEFFNEEDVKKLRYNARFYKNNNA